MSDARLEVTEHMLSNPRRIGKIEVAVFMPTTLDISDHDKAILEKIGDSCPVMKSLHPELEVVTSYKW